MQQNLDYFLSRADVRHTWLVDENSIFSAYDWVIKDSSFKDDDIIIFCHDDIEIWDDPVSFRKQLQKALEPGVGWIGVAGTTVLPPDSTWWDLERRKQGLHRGFVWQGKSRQDFYPNHFGPPGKVVALDGCFLAISMKTARSLDLSKPKFLSGQWDFYDIHYTISAHIAGLDNYVVPIHILHNSKGTPREDWHENRKTFSLHHRFKFPFMV